MKRGKIKRGSRVGDDLVEAFAEMSAYLRGETEVEAYEAPADSLTPRRIKALRRKLAASTKHFERQFGIAARTMEAYEQGRRRPNAAMETLLRVLEREPEAVRRAVRAEPWAQIAPALAPERPSSIECLDMAYLACSPRCIKSAAVGA